MSSTVNQKFSAKMASRVHKLKKLLKPVLRLLQGAKKSRPEPVAHPCQDSDYDENAANEAIESRLREDIVRSCSEEDGELRLWIDGHLTVIRGRIPTPVRFSYTPAGDLRWAPLADSDICLGRAHNQHTRGQTAEEQVPT